MSEISFILALNWELILRLKKLSVELAGNRCNLLYYFTLLVHTYVELAMY